MRKLGILVSASLLIGASGAQAAEKIRFGLNWLPQSEMCGFFQAKATGLYDKAGLDVELIAGGPDRNIPLLVASGELDLGMGSSFTTLNMVNRGIPGKTLAAYLQKDPQTLVAHAGQGVKTLADLKGRPIMVAKFSQAEFWQFLKTRHGFSDSQLRPYTYSAAPFLADPKAVQQGYITEDAMLLGKELPEPPVSIMLADYGYENYATTVFGMAPVIAKRHAAISAFMKASKQGWTECAAGNYAPAMKATLAVNPQLGQALYEFKMKQILERHMIDSGDAARWGAGAMSDTRWKSFVDTMTSAGVYPAKLDYKAAYTLEFSNAGAK